MSHPTPNNSARDGASQGNCRSISPFNTETEIVTSAGGWCIAFQAASPPCHSFNEPPILHSSFNVLHLVRARLSCTRMSLIFLPFHFFAKDFLPLPSVESPDLTRMVSARGAEGIRHCKLKVDPLPSAPD
ncbi:hypothetical protein SBV1_3470005 [Verrucomicrobia bacterium]|nr:hypothetical protein SBV1_3470005 [Verrucomicrobiota bacterium]